MCNQQAGRAPKKVSCVDGCRHIHNWSVFLFLCWDLVSIAQQASHSWKTTMDPIPSNELLTRNQSTQCVYPKQRECTVSVPTCLSGIDADIFKNSKHKVVHGNVISWLEFKIQKFKKCTNSVLLLAWGNSQWHLVLGTEALWLDTSNYHL